MAWLLQIPLEVRLAILACIGLAAGGQINRGVCSLTFFGQPLGPWRNPPKGFKRRWWHYLPVVGWWGVRKETDFPKPDSPHIDPVGKWFWVRPIFIELGCAAALPALYWFELQGGLIDVANATTLFTAEIHAMFLAHAILCGLMLVATFIDFDEQTIPDEITIPGVLIGLSLAALLPAMRLPILSANVGGFALSGIHLTSPHEWSSWLSQGPGLACGVACLLAWCFAVAPKITTLRKGVLKSLPLMLASMIRPRRKTNRPDGATPRRPFAITWLLLAIAVAGSACIVGVWFWGGDHWESLLSALVGMAFAAGVIWGVRISGSQALGVEAMGFGDVTLMAMIGAFIGWQASLVVFFLSPFAAIFIALTQYVLTRRNDLAFGPYLCFGALLLIVGWSRIWRGGVEKYFQIGNGWMIPVIVLLFLLLMGVILFVWRQIKERMLYGDED